MTTSNSNSNNNSKFEAKHAFTRIQSKKNKRKSKKSSSEYVVIVIGKSGVGKSSLIGLFASKCGGSNTATAGTSKSKIHKDPSNNTRCWMDTVGVGMDDSDEKTLKDILRLASTAQIKRIKIVWIVNGDLTRELREFQQQAKFIKSFSSKTNSRASAWDSCLIVRKEGKLKPRLKSIVETSQAAGSRIDYANKNDRHSLGYTYKDQISEDEYENYPTLELLYDDDDEPPSAKKLKTYGFLTDNQIREEINHRLSALPILELNFVFERCSICAVTGDPRYLYAKCHVRKEKHHPRNIVQYHSGKYVNTRASRIAVGAVVIGSVAAGVAGVAATIATAGLAAPIAISAVGGIVGGGAIGNVMCTTAYECCGGSKETGGCIIEYPCCKAGQKSNGCQTRCSTCKVGWGCAPGCTQSTN